MTPAPDAEPRIRIGVSSCLLGDAVRWDGRHKHLPFLTDAVGPRVDWIRVCPEVEIGLGVPRPAIRMVAAAEAEPRLVETGTQRDLTDRMETYARDRVAELDGPDGVDGWVLKSRSPSCGLDVEVEGATGRAPGRAPGRFARVLRERRPGLPVVEETDLQDEPTRRHFFERAAAHQRLRTFFSGAWTLETLIAFHERHELQVISHSAEARRELAMIVAQGAGGACELTAAHYREAMARALASPAPADRAMGTLLRAWNRLDGRLPAERAGEVEAAVRDF
ncbi:MAG: DUF1722 domain-containing protein, partial [Gemmatimonadetes bacterium]|nr:DUF1722 domain-containing protein [Gemmatimonadota bacterium]